MSVQNTSPRGCYLDEKLLMNVWIGARSAGRSHPFAMTSSERLGTPPHRARSLGDPVLQTLQRCAEPAGERCSQREPGSVGGLVEGCRPGDGGVRVDQEGVRWPVIGRGGEDLDAVLPVSGGLAEV